MCVCVRVRVRVCVCVLAFKFAMQRRPGEILASLYWVLILCITYVVRLGEVYAYQKSPVRIPKEPCSHTERALFKSPVILKSDLQY